MTLTDAEMPQVTAPAESQKRTLRAGIAQKGGILLVVPPFQTTFTPAIGVSQLKSNLDAQSFATEILYLNLHYAERIGVREYEAIVRRASSLFGDYVFSRVLYGHEESELERYVQEPFVQSVEKELKSLSPRSSPVQILHRLIEAAREWVDRSTQIILDRDPWMVGFTSMFQQNCSSLAVMRELKKRRSAIITAMGGSNCEGEMGKELFDRFPEIDYLGRGECDHSFIDLVRSLRNGNSGHPTPGILSRRSSGNGKALRPTLGLLTPADIEETPSSHPLRSVDLEKLPHPDFSDFFAQLPLTNFGDQISPALQMETSRGCWWGAKQHCTFCGLNAEGMAYRAKSGPRALEEMEAQIKRYGIRQIQVVDNILDMQYFKSVLPYLAERPIADLYYETKANLSKAQVKMLADSGIRWIQPGIESLSDSTLKLMAKGVTELQNIQLLKWAMEFGVSVDWNFLYGFPGERDEELEQVASHAESLHHLEPPVAAIVLNLDRFSPYFKAPQQYGLEPVYPAKPYRYVYPFSEDSLKRLAYFYDSDFFMGKVDSAAFKTLKGVVARWGKAYSRSHLLSIPRQKNLIILDTRPCARRFVHRLTGLRRKVYECCDKATALNAIVDSVEGNVSAEEVESVLQSLIDDKLMLGVNGRYLSLAIPQTGSQKRLTKNRPIGNFRPASLGAYARRVAKLRDPRAAFGLVARTVHRIWKAATTELRWKTLSVLVKTFSQSQVDEGRRDPLRA
jgi:ribosomal peptide maturation radical SAM protein 1